MDPLDPDPPPFPAWPAGARGEPLDPDPDPPPFPVWPAGARGELQDSDEEREARLGRRGEARRRVRRDSASTTSSSSGGSRSSSSSSSSDTSSSEDERRVRNRANWVARRIAFNWPFDEEVAAEGNRPRNRPAASSDDSVATSDVDSEFDSDLEEDLPAEILDEGENQPALIIAPNRTVDFQQWTTDDVIEWARLVIPGRAGAATIRQLRNIENFDGERLRDLATDESILGPRTRLTRALRDHAARLINEYNRQRLRRRRGYQEVVQRHREEIRRDIDMDPVAGPMIEEWRVRRQLPDGEPILIDEARQVFDALSDDENRRAAERLEAIGVPGARPVQQRMTPQERVAVVLRMHNQQEGEERDEEWLDRLERELGVRDPAHEIREGRPILEQIADVEEQLRQVERRVEVLREPLVRSRRILQENRDLIRRFEERYPARQPPEVLGARRRVEELIGEIQNVENMVANHRRLIRQLAETAERLRHEHQAQLERDNIEEPLEEAVAADQEIGGDLEQEEPQQPVEEAQPAPEVEMEEERPMEEGQREFDRQFAQMDRQRRDLIRERDQLFEEVRGLMQEIEANQAPEHQEALRGIRAQLLRIERQRGRFTRLLQFRHEHFENMRVAFEDNTNVIRRYRRQPDENEERVTPRQYLAARVRIRELLFGARNQERALEQQRDSIREYQQTVTRLGVELERMRGMRHQAEAAPEVAADQEMGGEEEVLQPVEEAQPAPEVEMEPMDQPPAPPVQNIAPAPEVEMEDQAQAEAEERRSREQLHQANRQLRLLYTESDQLFATIRDLRSTLDAAANGLDAEALQRIRHQIQQLERQEGHLIAHRRQQQRRFEPVTMRLQVNGATAREYRRQELANDVDAEVRMPPEDYENARQGIRDGFVEAQRLEREVEEMRERVRGHQQTVTGLVAELEERNRGNQADPAPEVEMEPMDQAPVPHHLAPPVQNLAPAPEVEIEEERPVEEEQREADRQFAIVHRQRRELIRERDDLFEEVRDLMQEIEVTRDQYQAPEHQEALRGIHDQLLQIQREGRYIGGINFINEHFENMRMELEDVTDVVRRYRRQPDENMDEARVTPQQYHAARQRIRELLVEAQHHERQVEQQRLGVREYQQTVTGLDTELERMRGMRHEADPAPEIAMGEHEQAQTEERRTCQQLLRAKRQRRFLNTESDQLFAKIRDLRRTLDAANGLDAEALQRIRHQIHQLELQEGRLIQERRQLQRRLEPVTFRLRVHQAHAREYRRQELANDVDAEVRMTPEDYESVRQRIRDGYAEAQRLEQEVEEMRERVRGHQQTVTGLVAELEERNRGNQAEPAPEVEMEPMDEAPAAPVPDHPPPPVQNIAPAPAVAQHPARPIAQYPAPPVVQQLAALLAQPPALFGQPPALNIAQNPALPIVAPIAQHPALAELLLLGMGQNGGLEGRAQFARNVGDLLAGLPVFPLAQPQPLVVAPGAAAGPLPAQQPAPPMFPPPPPPLPMMFPALNPVLPPAAPIAQAIQRERHGNNVAPIRPNWFGDFLAAINHHHPPLAVPRDEAREIWNVEVAERMRRLQRAMQEPPLVERANRRRPVGEEDRVEQQVEFFRDRVQRRGRQQPVYRVNVNPEDQAAMNDVEQRMRLMQNRGQVFQLRPEAERRAETAARNELNQRIANRAANNLPEWTPAEQDVAYRGYLERYRANYRADEEVQNLPPPRNPSPPRVVRLDRYGRAACDEGPNRPELIIPPGVTVDYIQWEPPTVAEWVSLVGPAENADTQNLARLVLEDRHRGFLIEALATERGMQRILNLPDESYLRFKYHAGRVVNEHRAQELRNRAFPVVEPQRPVEPRWLNEGQREPTLIIPTGRGACVRHWPPNVVASWIDDVCPGQDNEEVKARIRDEELDGSLLLHLQSPEGRDLLRVSDETFVRIRSHAAKVHNHFIRLRYRRDMADWEDWNNRHR